MNKLSIVLLVVISMFLFGCNSAPKPTAVDPTQTPTVEATLTPAPTVEPTQTPSLYHIVGQFDYDSADYGTYSVSWKIAEGGTEEKAALWSEIINDFAKVEDNCVVSNAEIGGWEASVSNVGDMWSQKPLSPACVFVLEKFSGNNLLTIPDQNLGKERPLRCENGKVCDVLTKDQIKAIKPDLKKWDMVVSNPADEFFSIETSDSRLEPNSEKYPGFGLKFLYPTSVEINQTGVVPQMGIINWGKNALCFNQPGWVGFEGGAYIPGGSQKCISTSDFPDDVDPWAFSSQGKLDDNTLITWFWSPSAKDGVLTLRVVDVYVTRLQHIKVPININEPSIYEPTDSKGTWSGWLWIDSK